MAQSVGNFVLAHRASIIIYNLIRSRATKKKYLLPANICPIVPAIFLKAKVPFRFVDVEEQTFSMDLDTARAIIRESPDDYEGLVFVRNFGIMRADHSEQLDALKSDYPHLLMIDDRCAAWPSFEPEGSGDVVLYSTGYSKPVDLGWGGFAFFLNEEVAYSHEQLPYQERHHEELLGEIRSASDQKRTLNYVDTPWLGDTAWKMDVREYENRVGQEMSKASVHKARLNEIYHHHLPTGLAMPAASHDWRFQLLTDKKVELLAAIYSEGFFASGHYASLVDLFGKNDACPVAARYERRIVNLFNDFRFSEEQAMAVCEIISRVHSVQA